VEYHLFSSKQPCFSEKPTTLFALPLQSTRHDLESTGTHFSGIICQQVPSQSCHMCNVHYRVERRLILTQDRTRLHALGSVSAWFTNGVYNRLQTQIVILMGTIMLHDYNILL
jgi:hypothetical protein